MRTESKIKSLPLIDVYNPMWYLFWFDLRRSSITSFALSLIMISMLSLYECITHCLSLSLEESKLTAIEFFSYQVFRDHLWYLLIMV